MRDSGLNVSSTDTPCIQSGTDTCGFRVIYYTASSGGTTLATETFTNVEIGDHEGVVNLGLGTGSFSAGSESSFENIFKNNTTVYAEVRFDHNGNASYTEIFGRMSVRGSAYSVNSQNLGGRSSSGYVQLSPGGTAQADSSGTDSIFINKTGSSGNLLRLQKSGSDVLVLNNDGTNMSVEGSIYAVSSAIKLFYNTGLSMNTVDFYGDGGVSTSNNGDLYLSPHGTGKVIISNGSLTVSGLSTDGVVTVNSGVLGSSSIISSVTGLTRDDGDLTISTTTSGNIIIAPYGYLEVSGDIIPSVDDTYSLGSEDNRWKDVYVGPGTIYIGEKGEEGSISYDKLTEELQFSATVGVTGSLNTSGGYKVGGTTVIDGSRVWQGGTIGVEKGGTGRTSLTSGQVLVGNGSGGINTLSREGIDSRTAFPAASHSHPVSEISDASTVGQNLVRFTNPSAVRYIRINADNTVSARTAAELRVDIGAEPAFSKGGLVQGDGMSLSGTLTGRLVGSGDITITIEEVIRIYSRV